MALCTPERQFEVALICSDPKKTYQLRSDIRSPVHHFPNVQVFLHFLASTPNTSLYLLLLISTRFMRDLSLNIKAKVLHLYTFTEDVNDNNDQTFPMACLVLRSLIIGQWTTQAVASYHSKDISLAQAYARQIFELNKIHIQKLQDVYDELDKEDQEGQEPT